MTTNRRSFLKSGTLGLAAGTFGATSSSGLASGVLASDHFVAPELSRQGPKEVVHGKNTVASSQSPVVTETMLNIMEQGGNAADAAIAGSLVQATIQPEMTNMTGTVSWLHWSAAEQKPFYLNSMGTLHPDLAPFRTFPSGLSGVAAGPPMACIPGFMPGMQAVHERFGSQPWRSLVEPAIPWAEDGFRVDEFQRMVMEFELQGNTWFPDMRELFAPDGFTPSVGELFRNPALATTLRHLAEDGPEYFTNGGWGREFVRRSNEIGWNIEIEDLSANQPRWNEPFRFQHKDFEVVQPAPPESQGVFCCLVLGLLRHLDISSMGHYSESPESLYFMAQALRRASFEMGYLHDPQYFGSPNDVWMSEDYLAKAAKILRQSLPKDGVDLTRHVELTTSKHQLDAFGWSVGEIEEKVPQPSGSCELTCVDKDGNWVQMMHTLQSGGIPGMVVGGVPMAGSHARFGMNNSIHGWLGLPGSRMRSIMSNSFIFKNGVPVHSMGSPGNVHCTVPQMLSNVMDYDFNPYQAASLPRMLPMRDDYTIEIESRISRETMMGLARLGTRLRPLPPYDWHMGSYQQAWRDSQSGLLSASTDPRRAGQADGIVL